MKKYTIIMAILAIPGFMFVLLSSILCLDYYTHISAKSLLLNFIKEDPSIMGMIAPLGFCSIVTLAVLFSFFMNLRRYPNLFEKLDKWDDFNNEMYKSVTEVSKLKDKYLRLIEKVKMKDENI